MYMSCLLECLWVWVWWLKHPCPYHAQCPYSVQGLQSQVNKDNTIPLLGWVPDFKREDTHLLPSAIPKSVINIRTHHTRKKIMPNGCGILPHFANCGLIFVCPLLLQSQWVTSVESVSRTTLEFKEGEAYLTCTKMQELKQQCHLSQVNVKQKEIIKTRLKNARL